MRFLAPLILTLSLAGCGLSPQLVQIHPELERGSGNLGQNQAVAVSVSDLRDSEAFGTRGGLYKETALIRAANDIQAETLAAVRQALQERGYNAFNPAEGAQTLDVRISKLDYVPEAGSVVNRVEVTAVIEAVASRTDGSTFSGRYQAGNTYEQPLTPSASRNEMMINDVLQRSLNKMLADPGLHGFLNGSAPASAD